jgi:pimeloyl-ACP methyl ester carboxylesterase
MIRFIIVFCLSFNYSAAISQSSIHVVKSGQGSPVLFLPGFTSPGSVWEETIRHLKGKNQSFVVSYAGFNGLKPIGMPWYQTIKKELLAYIRNENLKGIKVVGHSMGGNLAADLAAEMPDRFKSVIIVDALACMREIMMPGVGADKLEYNSAYNKRLIEMNETDFTKTATMMAGSMTNVEDKKDSLIKWALAADRETYVYGYTDLLKLDLRDSLPKITAGVLILGAPYTDRNQTAALYEKQYARLSNKKIEIANASRHFIMFDQPEWFYQQVNTFFSR